MEGTYKLIISADIATVRNTIEIIIYFCAVYISGHIVKSH